MTDITGINPPTLPGSAPGGTEGTQPAPGTQTQAAQTQSPAITAGTVSADIYGQFFGSRLGLSTLGLSQPRNFGDAEAILADVADQLERTLAKVRNAAAEKNASALGSALESISGMVGEVNEQTQSRNAKESELQDKKAELQGKQAELGQKQNQLGQKQNQLGQKQSQLATVNAEIAGVESQIAVLEAQKNGASPSEVAAIDQQIAALQGELTSLNAQKSQLDSDISALESDIASLQADIDSLETDIARLETEIQTLENEIAKLNESLQIAEFFEMILLFMVAIDREPTDLSRGDVQEMDRRELAQDNILQGLDDLERLNGIDQAEEQLRAILEEMGLEAENITRVTAALFANAKILEEIVAVLENLVGEPLVGEESERVGLLGALNQEESATVASAARVRLGI